MKPGDDKIALIVFFAYDKQLQNIQWYKDVYSAFDVYFYTNIKNKQTAKEWIDVDKEPITWLDFDMDADTKHTDPVTSGGLRMYPGKRWKHNRFGVRYDLENWFLHKAMVGFFDKNCNILSNYKGFLFITDDVCIRPWLFNELNYNQPWCCIPGHMVSIDIIEAEQSITIDRFNSNRPEDEFPVNITGAILSQYPWINCNGSKWYHNTSESYRSNIASWAKYFFQEWKNLPDIYPVTGEQLISRARGNINIMDNIFFQSFNADFVYIPNNDYLYSWLGTFLELDSYKFNFVTCFNQSIFGTYPVGEVQFIHSPYMRNLTPLCYPEVPVLHPVKFSRDAMREKYINQVKKHTG